MSWISQLLAGLTALTGHLPQSATNGDSTWGLLPSPNLPVWLNGPHTSSTCGSVPNTGVTRHYNFTITRGYKSPDGYNKSVILVNNQFPGPLIEANWGDMIEVQVTNKIDYGLAEGTSLHWHGFLQSKTPWYDGVPGVSQCPIAPDGSFTYTFQADQFGTTWYHSHFSSQYNDGLVGPIVVHGPDQRGVTYDYDLGPIIVEDYTHDNYYNILKNAFMQPPLFPTVDTNLINGKGVYDCSLVTDGTACTNVAGFPKFNFTSGKTHRLRFINTGGAANQKITIDNHNMTVIANDFVQVKPYTTNVLTLGIGQRTDVLVKGTGKPTDAVWLRSDIDTDCLNLTYSNPHALAAIYYEKANTTTKPNTTATPWTSNHCQNDPLTETVPYCPTTPPLQPATVQPLEITIMPNETGTLLIFVNNQTFRTDYNQPILSLAANGNHSFPDHSNVYNFGSNSSVRVIWKNTFEMQHPLHLHGHNFWILAEGFGDWDGTVVNPQNPARRDVYILQPGTATNASYVVFEWEQDNPGVWPMHCHTALHLSVGLYVNVLEQPDLIRRDMQIPMVIDQTCKDWAKFSSKDYVDQIDSGV